jgi:hypothetical protein
MNPVAWIPLAVATLVLAAPVAAHKAHVHGVAQLAVAVDGPTLSVTIDAPLDGFVGFERPPRTDAERKTAADALSKLKDGAALFKPDAAAGCTLAEAKVSAPVLEPGAKAGGEHAELEASYTFSCSSPQALRALDVALFDAFRRLTRIEVQVAGAQAQSKVTLRRPAQRVTLAR